MINEWLEFGEPDRLHNLSPQTRLRQISRLSDCLRSHQRIEHA
jgi:hypothetical protein